MTTGLPLPSSRQRSKLPEFVALGTLFLIACLTLPTVSASTIAKAPPASGAVVLPVVELELTVKGGVEPVRFSVVAGAVGMVMGNVDKDGRREVTTVEVERAAGPGAVPWLRVREYSFDGRHLTGDWPSLEITAEAGQGISMLGARSSSIFVRDVRLVTLDDAAGLSAQLGGPQPGCCVSDGSTTVCGCKASNGSSSCCSPPCCGGFRE